MTNIKVGLFLFFGIVSALVSIFFLGSNKSVFQRTALLYTYFDSVQGLNKGAIVSLAGVKIGNVDSVEFDETKNLVKTAIMVQSDYLKKIKTDSTIEIKTQGALGDKFIYINPGKADDIAKDGMIMKSEYGNDILTILSKRSGDSEKIFNTITELELFVKGLNQNNKIPQIMKNLNSTTAHLDNMISNVHFDKTMNKLDRIMDKIDRGEGTLGALINDRAIHERIKSLLGAGQKQQQVRAVLKTSLEDDSQR